MQPQPQGAALLSLDSSQVNVEGNYSCVADNLAGNASLLVQILVASECRDATGGGGGVR